jgi:hypothetical protein
MTETLEMTKADSISDLKTAVREASKHERQLSLEQDAMPEKIKSAAWKDARSKAL